MHEDQRHHYRDDSRNRDNGRDGYSTRRDSPRRRDDGEHYRARNEDSRSPRRSRSPYSRHQRDLRGDYRDRQDYTVGRGVGKRDDDDERDRGNGYDEAPLYDDRPNASHARHDKHIRPTRTSATLIAMNLPDDIIEDDVIEGFKSASSSSVFRPDYVKAVRLRTSKRETRIAFVEFYKEEDAIGFLEYHNAQVEIYTEHHKKPFAVHLEYQRQSEPVRRDDEGRQEDEWHCYECGSSNYSTRRQCRECNARRGDQPNYPSHSTSSGPLLDGKTDEDPQQLPSQYLVIRGLEGDISEEIFATGVKKLYAEETTASRAEKGAKLRSTAPTANAARMGAQPESLRRVFLMRDSVTDATMRYGFAEFTTVEDAHRAITKFKASTTFSISTKPSTVAFIHTGVFVPLADGDMDRLDDNPRLAFHPVYNNDIWLKYWDSRVYPSIYEVSMSQSPPDNTAASAKGAITTETADSADTRKAKKPKLAQTTGKNTISLNPQMQMWVKKAAELGQIPASAGIADDDTGDGDSSVNKIKLGTKRPRVRASYTSFSDVDSLTCMLCLRRFKSELELRDHEVLSKAHMAKRSDDAARSSATERLATQGKKPQIITLRISRVAATADSAPAYTSYANREELQCLLCQRKFGSTSMLSLHERESELHQRNAADPSNLERAISHLARVGKSPRKMVPNSRGGPQYRDRARERRKAFGISTGQKKTTNKDTLEPATNPATTPAPSKGAALLGKMGWTAGEGLGASNDGMKQAISTDIYAAGVGLGAEGGKLGDAVAEAARQTKGHYSDFLEQTREKARQRFEKMGS